jgi:2-dehydro-3-deoxyphosphogluconate aldolase/(4S)-4-hydroxy-2-oxoglutarate aldolase
MAIAAGAEFLVAPTFHPEVVQTARRFGKVSIPGAFTPTEILTAWEAGADIVKVFPAEVLGPTFFQAVLRPLPQVRLMPTGNISVAAAAEFLQAGACGIGIGGGLSDPTNLKQAQQLAAQYVDVVRANPSCR